MKILTYKEQVRALEEIKKIRDAIVSGNEIRILMSIENLAELVYIIGGFKALKELHPEVFKDLDVL